MWKMQAGTWYKKNMQERKARAKLSHFKMFLLNLYYLTRIKYNIRLLYTYFL